MISKWWKYVWGFIRKLVLLKNCTRVICSCWDKGVSFGLPEHWGGFSHLRPTRQFVTNEANTWFQFALCVNSRRRCVLLAAFFVLSLDDATDTFDMWLSCLSLTRLQTHAVLLSWSLTPLWVSQNWNLTLHILQARKGAQFQWTSIDFLLWASLVNDLCLTLFFFFLVLLPCQRCPKLKGPAICRALSCSTCSMREGPPGQMLPPWGDPASGGEGSDQFISINFTWTLGPAFGAP